VKMGQGGRRLVQNRGHGWDRSVGQSGAGMPRGRRGETEEQCLAMCVFLEISREKPRKLKNVFFLNGGGGLKRQHKALSARVTGRRGTASSRTWRPPACTIGLRTEPLPRRDRRGDRRPPCCPPAPTFSAAPVPQQQRRLFVRVVGWGRALPQGMQAGCLQLRVALFGQIGMASRCVTGLLPLEDPHEARGMWASCPPLLHMYK
jgi:hypothetical protein